MGTEPILRCLYSYTGSCVAPSFSFLQHQGKDWLGEGEVVHCMQTWPLLLVAWETSESICSLARKASRKQFRAVCEAFDQRQCLEENTSSIVIGRF